MIKNNRILLLIAFFVTLFAGHCIKAIGFGGLLARVKLPGELAAQIKQPFAHGFSLQSLYPVACSGLANLWKIGTGIAVATMLVNIFLSESRKTQLRQKAFWGWFMFKREPVRIGETVASDPQQVTMQLIARRIEALEKQFTPSSDGSGVGLLDRIAVLEQRMPART